MNDERNDLPNPEVPAPEAAAPAPAPVPAPAFDYTPPAVSAATQAKEFVARIFADVGAADDPAEAQQEATEGAAADAPPESPLPAIRPGEALDYMAGRSVLILGLGASGLAMARWCARCGAQVTVADTRENPPQLAQLRAELPQAQFLAGPFDAALVEGRALHAVYRSPGLAPADIAPVMVAASACQISAEGELGLYSEALRELRARHGYAPAVLAITGTNGKTTVTSLTGLLVECAGRSVAVAGNIGPTLLDTLGQRLDAGTLPEVWVLELSSFQLDGARGFAPTAAAVLNVTQDHLDWHGRPRRASSARPA
jgi:UDP-N-acetylmuramoylalanine--D-glutamate ligase